MGVAYGSDIDMVREIRSDSGKVHHRLDSVGAKLVGGPQPREQQELGRRERPGREHDFSARPPMDHSTVVAQAADPHRGTPIELHAEHRHAGLHAQRALPGAPLQVSVRAARSISVRRVVLHRAEALGRSAVQIVGPIKPGLDAGRDERGAQLSH